MEEWSPIENNPGLFTQLIKNIGVKGVQVEEILSYDFFENITIPIYGLIFISKYTKNISYTPNILPNWDKDIFFSKQLYQNSNAIQSILEILLNNDNIIDIGPNLKELKSSMGEMDPLTRGLTVSNCEYLKQEQFKLNNNIQNGLNKNDEDVYHFITYINYKNAIYELDGLQEGPILIENNVSFDDWIKKVKPFLMEKINYYSNNEIEFNLMALIPDKLEQLSNNKNVLISKKNYIEEKIKGNNETKNENEFKEINKMNKEQLEENLKKIELEINECNNGINIEKMKINKYKEESERKQHNYTPFIFELLKIMAQNNILGEIYQQNINEQNK